MRHAPDSAGYALWMLAARGARGASVRVLLKLIRNTASAGTAAVGRERTRPAATESSSKLGSLPVSSCSFSASTSSRWASCRARTMRGLTEVLGGQGKAFSARGQRAWALAIKSRSSSRERTRRSTETVGSSLLTATCDRCRGRCQQPVHKLGGMHPIGGSGRNEERGTPLQCEGGLARGVS